MKGIWLTVAEFATALVNNGIGNHKAALIPARRAADQPDLALSAAATVELVEAAARCGEMHNRDRLPCTAWQNGHCQWHRLGAWS